MHDPARDDPASSPPGRAPADPAAVLRGAREQVLRRWEESVRAASAAAADEPREVIRDHIPHFLETLADALEAGAVRREAVERQARRHGQERVRWTEYGLDDVFGEYRLLRRVVLDLLEERAPLDVRSRDLVFEVTEMAVARAAGEFVAAQFEREREIRQLAERASRRLRDLQTVTEAALVGRVALSSLLDDLLGRVQRVFACDTVAVLLADEEGRQLSVVAARGLGAELDVQVPAGRGVVGRCFAAREARAVEDLSLEPEVLSPGLREVVTSMAVAPLSLVDRAVGVLHVGSRARRRFSEDEVRLLALIADRVAVAIEHARLYEAAQERLQELRQERSRRESFVAALMHDLRTPLSALAMSLELLRQLTQEPAFARPLDLAERNVRRLDRLTRDLLDVTRVRGGRALPITPQEVDLTRLARDLTEELCALHGVDRCQVHADSSAEVRGWWDAEALRRVLQNLLENGLKYGSGDTPVSVEVEGDERQAKLRVHNEGPPIPAHLQERAFDLFEQLQAPDPASDRSRSWGIGLTLVRGLVEAHGGTVAVVSSAERGTTFTVELPRDARSFAPNRESWPPGA